MMLPPPLLPHDRHAERNQAQVRLLRALATGTAYCLNCSAPYPAALDGCPECTRKEGAK